MLTSNKMFNELLQAFSTIPFNKMLGLKLEHLTEKEVTLSFAMTENLIGNFMQKILHGGVISAVLDMAGGMVVMATAVHKNADKSLVELTEILANCSTVDLQVNYLRPGKGDHFVAKAYLLKSGNHISFTRMELFSQSKLLATASGTYLLK